MAKIGYLRVSTEEQRPDRQIDGLSELCDELYIETVSATNKSRPVYESAIQKLQAHDTFIVWSLDRAWRSVVDTICAVEQLQKRQINLNIVDMNIDLSTPTGRLFLSIVASMAEFERSMLSVRTKQGMAAARKRGKHIGRPHKLTISQIKSAHAEIQAGKTTIMSKAKELGVCRDTLSKAVRLYCKN
ncbi:MAG: recombinase family protein [Alphaproteobacteria bacterium]|nr:recombinase family protein [Alphaproteobacteria bacterium]